MQQRRPQRDAAQPFDQRFLLFAIGSMAILLLYNSMFQPPPVEPPAEKPAEEVALEEATPSDNAVVAAPEVDAPSDEIIEEAPLAAPRRVSLGSVDPEGVYRMLLTLNNVGAGLERLELSSDNYRDIDDRSGYLGDLALEDAPLGGATATAVGPGTPAAEAGLVAGDVIRSATLGDEPAVIKSSADLVRLLKASKPGQEVQLVVARGGDEQSLTAELRRQPLDLIRPEIENLALHDTKPPEGYESPASFLVKLVSVNARGGEDPQIAEANRRLSEAAWTVAEETDESVTLRQRLPALGLEFRKRYTVTATPEDQLDNKAHPSYHFDLSVEVENLGAEPQRVAYELTGPNGLPIEGFWYSNKVGRSFSAYGLRDVIVRFVDSPINQISCRDVVDGDVDSMGQGAPLAFVGVDAQYFASVVIPRKPSLRDVRMAEVRTELATAELGKKALDTWENASCVLSCEPLTLAPGESFSDDYQVFAGPKLPALLSSYNAGGDPGHSLQELLYYGWFGPVARLMLVLLHTFYAIVGNYGVAIVMLTVVVRGAMFPISRQQALNMVKMQELKPELDQLAEKYKDDMQKRSQAQQELFRKHNYNPAAGCLPLFLQLPIFLGLYRALTVDVELRQAPLFTDSIRFCGNLAAPDQLYDWSWLMPHWVDTGQGFLRLGPYFNLLPIATVLLFLLQQKMFMPEATTEQAQLQQKMMKYMMGFMGLLFFAVPSGLCIYFIASSLWGITERKMLPKPPPAPPATTPTTTTKKAKTVDASEVARAKAKRKKSGGKKRK